MIKKIIKRLYISYLLKKKPLKYARFMGVKVGDGTRFNSPKHGMFGSEPFLITIGKNCLVATNVHFVTHDGSVYLLNDKHPKCDLFGKIKIGDNVFIGLNTIILRNVTIGDNVIIGAGSVVTKSIPSNSVAAGVPAKVVTSLDNYLNKIEKEIIHTGGMPMKEKRPIIEEALKNS